MIALHRTLMLTALLTLAQSCDHRGRFDSYRSPIPDYPVEADAGAEPYSPAPETAVPSRPAYEARAGSFGEFADEMNIDLALLQVALASCDLYNRCIPGKRTRVPGCTESFAESCPQCNCSDGCDVPMLLAWCEGKNCRQGIPHEDPRWGECAASVKARTCDDLNATIECEITQQLGLTEIRPLDFLAKKQQWP